MISALWAAAGSAVLTKLEEIAKGFIQADENSAQMPLLCEVILIPKKSHAQFSKMPIDELKSVFESILFQS